MPRLLQCIMIFFMKNISKNYVNVGLLKLHYIYCKRNNTNQHYKGIGIK